MSSPRIVHLLSSSTRYMCCTAFQERTIASRAASLYHVTTRKYTSLTGNVFPRSTFPRSSLVVKVQHSSSLVVKVQRSSSLVVKVQRYSTKQFTAKPIEESKREVYVSSYDDFDHNIDYLHDVFEHFGEVVDVRVPKFHIYEQTEHNPGSHRFAFVTFKRIDSARDAISAGSISTHDGAIINIAQTKYVEEITECANERKRIIYVRKLPKDVTVHSLNDYFKHLGDVEAITLKFMDLFAKVVFRENIDVSTIVSDTHIIAGKKVVVKKNQPTKQFKVSVHGSQVVFLSSLNERTKEEEVTNYFQKIGPVGKVIMHPGGVATLQFLREEDAATADQLEWHDVGRSRVRARLTCIANE